MKPPPAPTRLSLLSPEVSLAVEPARMRALLAACFAPGLTALVKRDRRATARALWGREVPLYLADVLDLLAHLATPAGRDALVEAARDARREHAGWGEQSPADLAARLPAAPAARASALAAALRRVQGPGAGPVRRGGEAADAWVHEDDATGDLHAVVVRA